MTWLELKQFVDQIEGPKLYSEVKLYDFATGDEYDANITELLIVDNEEDEECDGWVPYLSINEEDAENGETKKTGVH